jgi:hypothetical protein
MGLTQLLSTHYDYDKELIIQFYLSLMIMNDDEHTLKWMSGST